MLKLRFGYWAERAIRGRWSVAYGGMGSQSRNMDSCRETEGGHGDRQHGRPYGTRGTFDPW